MRRTACLRHRNKNKSDVFTVVARLEKMTGYTLLYMV